MSNFIRPWDTNTESQEQEQATSKRSLFDNIGDAITAIGANFNEVRGSERLGDLRDELMNSGALSDAEYETLKNKYAQESAERQAARDTYKTAHNNLVADDSFFKNVDQLGGTLEGMAAQGIGTAVGAGVGFLSPFVGGTAMGAKIGNAAGAVAGGYLDARSVALQAEEDVLNNGGTWEQAKRAYDETLKKASLTTLPETLVDIAMGNRLVGSALNSRAARKIAGSTLGRMGSSVLDPAAKIGTQAAFKSGSTLVGRGAGILADTALQGSTEAVQEVTQDYIGNREVAKAMGQTDNEYSLGGFKDFALSDQGLETMKTAGIMGALFGGVGGTLSSGQYLTRGAETNTGIRAHNNTEKMINDGTLKIDKERRQDEEKIISALTGISPTELATWSDADIVAEASILEGQYMGVTGEAEDMATTRGAADVVRRLTSKEDNTIHREGDVTETSRAFLKGMGVDDKMLEGMFNSPVEKSLMEKARKAEEQAARQEKTGEKQQTTARLTDDTAKSMRENEGKSAIENIKEEAQQNKAETTTEKTPSNNLGSAAKQQEQQGKIDTSDNIEYKDSLPGNWEADPQEFEKDAMLDQQSYYNANTNKKAVIARATDGGFNVVTDLNEERGDTPHFDTLEAAENYLTGKQDDINFQESNGEQTKEGTTEDPNIVPKGGVDARGNNHSGELINSVDDLFNFMQQNPGIIGRGEFIEFVHAKHNLGVNDLNMYLDRKNEGRVYNQQTGQWGYVNAKKFHDEATGRAMIQLYRGGDIISAVHEIAHIGYENLSVQDKATFNRYAVKSMGQWIADMLDVNYDDALRQRLHNLQNDEELRKKIEDSPALRQTVIAFLNAEQNGVDLNHLTADQIRAIDERWAWEFSMWYTEGYMRGVEPQNILQRIYQRGIFSLGRELNMLNRLWEHIHHKDNQDIENLYTGRRNQTEEQVAQEEEIINPFEAPPVTPQQTQQAAPVVTPVEQTVQQQAPVTPPVEQAQAPVPQEQPQVVQAQTQTEPVQEKPKNNKRQKQPKQPKEPQMTEQELNEQKWRVETGKFLKQFEGARPKQIEQSDADRLNGIINQIKEHPELDKSQGISKRISSILKKFFDQNAQPAQQEQTQQQIQEKPQTAEQTTPVTETHSVQQPEQAPKQGEKGAGLVPAKNLTNQNKNATVKQKQEVANSGKTEDTRGTENLRTDVGEVQGGRSVRQGNDNRTGEGRVGQNAVEGRSEGNGENLSLLKNSKFKSVYNARKEKKTELKDWRDLSGDDKLKQVFVDALNKSKEADSQHGVYVDSKTVEELKDCKVILHKNKMAGFAITPDGNIVGVFSNPKNPIRGILNDMIFIARMLGGNRMDCFGKFLLRGYRNCGFTPVARTSFAEEYYPADNPANATIRKEKPDVYFLVKDNDNNNTYLNKVENDVYMNDAIDADSVYHIDSEDSYGDALGFQGQVLEEIQKKENKNKSTKEVADSLRPKEETATETQEITETQEQNTSIEEENPSTTEEQTEQDQASEERKEDLLNYTNYPEEFATREEALKSVDDEKVLNEKDKQEVIDYINEWYDEIEGKQKPETTEKQVEEEQKPKQEQTTKAEETSDIEKKIDEMLESRRKQREEKGLEEESPEQIKEIREQYRKFFMLSNQNKTTKGKTTKTNKTNKTTKSKTKQADPLAELHKKYKNITGTPIGEKGYRFKDDEKQFITAFKQNIDWAVGNKEELLKVSKQLDGWFQNNPTERNRMVRKYLSNYLVDAGQIKVDDGVRNQESNKVERAQQILDNAFPNTRFQYAWHGTRHDFNEFTLEHLSSGEGSMVHGWGLYFESDLQRDKKAYFDQFKAGNVVPRVYFDGKFQQDYDDYFAGEVGAGNFGAFNINSINELINYMKKDIRIQKSDIKNIQKEFGESGKPVIEEFERQLKFTESLLRKTIKNKDKIKIEANEDEDARLILVDIPDNKYLLRKGSTFNEQPKFVQQRLERLIKDNNLRERWIKNNTNIYNALADQLVHKAEITDNDYRVVSELLNKYGIKGMSYNGERDGECVLMFDATSIDILSKFKQEEGKWKSEKVDNARNREVDKQKAQRKLEKRKQQDDGTRFQAAPVRLIGMNENELNEQYYKDYMKIGKQLGYDITEVEKSFSKYGHGLKDTNINTKSEPLAQIFVKVNDKINKQLWNKGKNVQRGLDGKWRFYIDDRNASIKNGVSKLLSDPDKINGRKFALGTLIKHDELFKYYPKLKSVMVEFKNLGKAKGESKGKNISSGIKINQYKIADTNDLMRTLLHEIQHNIQSEEGFARGGNSSEFLDSDSTVLFSALTDDVLSDKQKIVDFAVDNEYPITQKTIDRILNMNESDFKKYWEQNSTLGVILNDYVESNARHFEAYQNLLGEIEARDASNRFGMSDEEYKKQKPLNYVYAYRRLRENNNEVTVRYQESTKQDADERREEKEYNKRKERVEKAKEEGTLSDQMKDVYSVSFTKSAQEYAENRTKMEYFDNNEDYWDRTEDKSTGKVTYVRKTPYEHQQKVVTYNGVNDVKRENKKKSKPVQWIEWMKDQLIKYMFNDKHYLAKAARKLGVYDAYRRMIVTEGYALKANTALTQGIKYNGKTTRALNDIIRDVGEPKQKEFLKYCIAHRILDLKDRENPVFQKMKPDEARKYIEEIKASPDAELFERNRKDFVEYNKALLHVLVDGGIMDEKTFQKFCDVDPNFVPLTKVMDDADMGFSSIINAHNLVNLKSPIKKISTSMLEIANPFLEMQKRTAEYYAIASRNKAGQIFVNEIAGALEKTTEGDVIARGQGMLRRVRVDERNGQLITKPDDKQQIIYVCNNGKHEFYQVADKEIYQALTFMNADQMGTIHKMLDKIAHVPSGLVRETATMVPDFGVRNVIRDGGEAFLTSEHGFLPVIDQIWGMWQVMNNTEWAQMYFNQNGEYGTLNRDRVNSEGIASVDDVIDEKLNPLKNFKEIKQAQMAILKDKQRQFSILTDIKDGNFGDAWEHARKSRGMAALKLAISPLWAIGKSNKRMNDLFELGTRVGEFKNAKMGFEGTLDRMARGIMNTNLKEAEFQKKAQSDVYAAHVAKDITLNFSQHGKLGKELNRYIPFFNASLQGIYKLCNTLETMATGTTISGGKNRRLQQELLFKAALITAMAVGVAAAGDGDEDYEEAPDYEKENFWILPNGLRFPKDQVLGKIIGNTVEKSYAQWKKGKAEPSTILKSILENFKPDRFMFAIFDLAIGGFGNYDTFKERSIVPEYMADKLGHLQKDISTSNFAVDVSEALWKCGFDISAKKIDWALQKNFSNCAKYATAIYDLGKKTFNPKEFNERIARGYDKNDSTGSMVAGLKDDIPSPINLVSGTFATNRSTFKSISDFYENYKKYKKLSSDEASMSKEDKRAWKRYEQAYKKDMTFRKQLRAIKQDRTLTGKQKREKADKIFKQQIKLAKWAEG